MSEKKRARPLARGLPRCLSGLRPLQTQLCLSTKTNPSRRDVLESRYVVDRIGAPDSEGGRKADRDRKRMLAFYGDPELRRELWDRHMDSPPSAPSGRSGKRGRTELLPPSLEVQVLGRFQDGSAPVAGGPGPEEPVWSEPEWRESLTGGILRRVEDWASLTKKARIDTTLQLFCLATLMDDADLLEAASATVPELATEFAELQPRADATKRPDGAADGNEWQAACRKLSVLASRAATGPAGEEALDTIRQATVALEFLDSRTALRELKSTLDGFLEEIEKDPSCSAIDDDQLNGLRGRWFDISGAGPATVRTELQRLRGTFGTTLASVRKAARRHKKAEGELAALRREEPTRGKARRDWENRRMEYRQAAEYLLKERRTAEGALLDGLAPSEKLANAMAPEPPLIQPPAPAKVAEPESGATGCDGVDARTRRETDALGEKLRQLERDVQSYGKERDDLRQQLHTANRELSSLKASLRHSQVANGSPQTDLLLELAARKEEPSPLECIDAIARASGERCIVLASARESAADMDQFRHGRKLLRLLRLLVTDYRDRLMANGDAEARQVFSANDYAAKESATVMGNRKLKRARIFRHRDRDIEMFQHLKIGRKADQRQTLRVHFAWDGESRRIVIGHCGKHLPRLKET